MIQSKSKLSELKKVSNSIVGSILEVKEIISNLLVGLIIVIIWKFNPSLTEAECK